MIRIGIIVCIGIVGLALLDSSNLLSFYNIDTIVWATILGPLLAVLGTYLVTKHSMDKQISEQRLAWDEEKTNNKENAYRAINKQNLGYFYKELKKFLARIEYMGMLKSIEMGMDRHDLFSGEYEKIIQYNKQYLKKVQGDYYYDEEVSTLCDEGIDLSSEATLEEVWGLYTSFKKYFFGYVSESGEEYFDQIKKNAFLKLYQSSYSARYLVLRMDAILNDKEGYSFFPHSEDLQCFLDFLDELIELEKSKKWSSDKSENPVISGSERVSHGIVDNLLDEICNLVDDEGYNSANQIYERITQDFFDGNQCEELLNLLVEYNDFDQICKYYPKRMICDYGIDEDKEIEKYLKWIENKYYPEGKSMDYSQEFVEPNQYL